MKGRGFVVVATVNADVVAVAVTATVEIARRPSAVVVTVESMLEFNVTMGTIDCISRFLTSRIE